jgi:lipoate-protein ligase B
MGHNASVSEERGAYLYDLIGEPRPYAEVVGLMNGLAAERLEGAIPDTVIVCEHQPTLTLGRATRVEAELDRPVEAYQALGWAVERSDRGGRSTWHGPGQLVVYPVLDLREHGKDLRRYAHDLEATLIGALGDLGIAAAVRPGREYVGVWVEQRKIASLGIRASHWIVTHGIALNVSCQLDPFAQFAACGLPEAEFTSVSAELGRPVAMAEARDAVLARLEQVFALRLDPLPVAA